MTYQIKEVFYSVQGEGYWSGRPAVFVRFAKCNLWSGREIDRPTAICQFCDTDFLDGTSFTTDELLGVCRELWPTDNNGDPMVIFTGGEPMLQLDENLLRSFTQAGFYTALETNGTLPLTEGMRKYLGWVCVSPKTPTLRITGGDELKLVYPQDKITPEMFAHLQRRPDWGIDGFDHFWLSPRNDKHDLDHGHAKLAYDYVLAHPQWRLNTQTHKVIGVR